MRKIYLFLVAVVTFCFHPTSVMADDWTYNFNNFGADIGNKGPKVAIDATLNGLEWHMYGVRSNYDDTDYSNGGGSMRIYGEVGSSLSGAEEMTNFTLMTSRSIGTFKFTMAANANWTNYQKEWIVQYSVANDVWTTIGDPFMATDIPQTISRNINQNNARVRIVRSDYQTFDYANSSSYSFIANIDDMSITEYTGTSAPTLYASVATLDFGDVYKGEEVSKSFTLTHKDLSNAVSMSITGIDAAAFTLETTELSENEADEIVIKCTGNRRGTYSALFQANADGLEVSVNLTGEGKMQDGVLYSGGQGSEEDPYLISSKEDLLELSYEVEKEQNSYVDTYFKMTNDISMQNVTGFRPIGNNFDREAGTEGAIRPFSGVFDGAGHTISNLSGSWSSYGFCGLFGIIDNAVIKNLTISNSTAYALYGVAALVGIAMNGSTIENCHTTSDVTVSSERYYTAGICAGTIVGTASRITDCTNAARVSGYWGMTAGILGTNTQSGTEVLRCGNTGEITDHNSHLGGVVGNTKAAMTIKDCYNMGEINMLNEQEADNTTGGGILGNASDMEYGQTLTIKSCYSIGQLNFLAEILHPIFDSRFSEATISNCYYSRDFNGYGYNNVTEVSSSFMRTTDFLDLLNEGGEGCWIFRENWDGGYPYPEGSVANSIATVSGNGVPRICFEGGRLVIDGEYDSVSIYDMNGRRLPTGNFSKGIYLVKVSANGKNTTVKVGW